MKRDKQFIKDSIKMDLFRVVTATGDLTKEIPQKSVEEFLTHAVSDFGKIELNPQEEKIKKKLETLQSTFNSIEGPKERLRWTEDIMTARCML